MHGALASALVVTSTLATCLALCLLRNGPSPSIQRPFLVNASIIKAVLSSAAEAELGALFYNAKEGCTIRNILEDLGHKQPPTPIQADNACAVGIANESIKLKRSKAMDMRFYWVRDRVKQGQFIVYWKKGSENDADYFTKHPPAAHHRLKRSRYIHEEPEMDHVIERQIGIPRSIQFATRK